MHGNSISGSRGQPPETHLGPNPETSNVVRFPDPGERRRRDPNCGSLLFLSNTQGGSLGDLIILPLGGHEGSDNHGAPVIDMAGRRGAEVIPESPSAETPEVKLPTELNEGIFATEAFKKITEQRLATSSLYYITCLKMALACSLADSDFEVVATDLSKAILGNERPVNEDAVKMRVEDAKKILSANGKLPERTRDHARTQFEIIEQDPPPIIDQLIDAIKPIAFGSKSLKYDSLALTIAAITDPDALLDA